MQLLFFITTLLLSLNCVSAANEIRFIFNNGFSPSTSSGCSDSELIKLDALFVNARRHLRRSDISITTTSETSSTSSDEARELTTLRNCADICEGYATGSCRKIGCKGVRGLSIDSKNDGDRNLISCSDELNAMHAKVDNLRNSVSTSCKNFLEKSKRTANCYPDYQYGQIQGLRVWKITSSGQTVFNPFVAPGGTVTICNSMRTNFESLNEPCVDDARLVMVGPNYKDDHTERISPYTLFGDDGVNFQSETLPNVGTYTLTITPDADPSKNKVFKVVVNKC